MNPRDLIRIAENLASGRVGGSPGRPRQADLRRAVSTAYYAMFHELAQSNANLLQGANPATRSNRAWRQVYRAQNHGHVKQQCANRTVLQRFPQEIQYFAVHFVHMQTQRHLADYDPFELFARPSVSQWIHEASIAIARFHQANRLDRRAFAAFVLFGTRNN